MTAAETITPFAWQTLAPPEEFRLRVQAMTEELDSSWNHPFTATHVKAHYITMFKQAGLDIALADARWRYQQHVDGNYPPLEVRQ